MHAILQATLLILIALGGGTACSTFKSSHSDPHHRFWRGYQHADIKQNVFETKINEEFIALYPGYVQYGLVSYLPVLPVRSKFVGPHEWALVTFRSQDHYDKFKQTDTGRIYADSHWNVFSKNVSFSTVVEPFKGDAEINHAYVTEPDFNDFADSKVVFVLYNLMADHHQPDEIAESIDRNHGASRKILKNIIFIVTREQVAEYLFFKSDADVTSLLPSLGADQVILLRDGIPGKDMIREGQGLKSLL